MPIAAAMTPMKSIIKQALSLKQVATNDAIAGIITAAMSSTVCMGMFPPGPTPVPLIPSGASGTMNMLKSALSLSQSASNSQIASMMANAISILVPTVPPSGQTTLKSMIENTVLNLSQSADNDMIAGNLANAIVTYYTCAGVV